MLRSYVQQEADWERYLPLVMFAYHTTVHSSTKVTPFTLMFGRQASFNSFTAAHAFDPASYHAQLQHKMASLRDMVEANLIEAAGHQKAEYDKHSMQPQFKANDPVWLSNPRRGKLDPKWENGWIVTNVKGETTVEIAKGNTTRTVHVNRLQHRVASQGTAQAAELQSQERTLWQPPAIDHIVTADDADSISDIVDDTSIRRYPQRDRQPPDWLRP